MKTTSVPVILGILAIILSISAIILAVAPAGFSPSGPDPISGSWAYNAITPNNTKLSVTLVFSSDGNFNGYSSGLLSLNGHWTKLNTTGYELAYTNRTAIIILNDNKTQIYDIAAPREIFIKQ
jgi:hypothetical protein